MNKFQILNLRLCIDCIGKLRISSNGGINDIWVVIGFKIKAGKQKNYLFPILKVEMPKK